MQALFDREARITNVMTASVERCNALGDPIRASIIHILSHRPMSTDQVVRALRKAGYSKATTTIRHHLDILRDCGLIEIVRVQEIRGAVEKFYAPTIRFLGFEDSFSAEGYNQAIKETSKKLSKILQSIAQRYGNKIKRSSNFKCSYCDKPHGYEYIIFEIINRALTHSAQTPEFMQILKKLESGETNEGEKESRSLTTPNQSNVQNEFVNSDTNTVKNKIKPPRKAAIKGGNRKKKKRKILTLGNRGL